MDDIGFQISLSDFRILFDQIDFDRAGEIDYFKFCLLDYDKVELREKLIRDHQLETVRKQSLNEDKSAFKKYTDGGQLNLRYLDGNMPKNKDVNNFINQVQRRTFK